MRIIVDEEKHEVHVEFTRRNLKTMLAKMSDPLSARWLFKQADDIESPWVVHMHGVEDNEHYTARRPGTVYMPSTGEFR